MRSYRYLHLDVFTDHVFGGNQLAVYVDGRGLTSGEMQSIAREMNFAETTFVLPAEQADTDLLVRIFTPGEELPMAGHPTVGTAFALARSGVLTPGRERVVFGLGIGPTDVSLAWTGDALTFAWMTQLPPVFGEPIVDVAAVAAALRLAPAAIANARLPVQRVSCGVPYLVVPLDSRRAVDAAGFDQERHADLFQGLGVEPIPLFIFSTEAAADGATAYCRMFAPQLGIPEDPATGSAAGPLGGYLVYHGIVPAGTPMTCRQGVKMGRPSTIHMAIGATGTQVTTVRVGGEAILAGEGTLYV